MRWSFELTCPTPEAEAKVNFARGEGEIPLHIAYRRGRGGLALNRKTGGRWGAELVIPTGQAEDPETVVVTVEPDSTGRVVLRHPGGSPVIGWLDAAALNEARIWTEGGAVRLGEGEAADSVALRLWRAMAGPSGIPAPVAGPAPDRRAPGLSVLVRAEGEGGTMIDCLVSLAGLADEIVLADASRGDGNFRRAEALKLRIFELRSHLYPLRPPARGAAQSREVLSGGRNTRAHFLNWALARSGRAVVMDWPADRIALRDALAEMIARHSLRSRGDGFALWTCGVTVYTDGERHWADTVSAPAGFSVLPAAHGAVWVNLPGQEEPDQSLLYRLPVLFHRRPVFAEIVDLGAAPEGEPQDRHQRRLGEVQAAHAAGGPLPEGLVEVSGPGDPALPGMELPEATLALSRALEARYRSRPKLVSLSDGSVQAAGKVPQRDAAVLVFSEPDHEDRRAAIRESWAPVLRRLGFPCLFVLGRPDLPSRISGDILHVAVPPGREFLGARVAAALEYSLGRLNVDRVLKLDDDCLIDPMALIGADTAEAEFVCGARGDPALADEVLGACSNPQLRDLPLMVPPGDWPDGRCGYMLGRKARLILMAHKEALRTALREDAVIAGILKGRGIDPAWGFGPRIALRHSARWRGRPEVALIAAFPDAAAMRAAWAELDWAGAVDRAAADFARDWRVDWDWQQIPGRG